MEWCPVYNPFSRENNRQSRKTMTDLSVERPYHTFCTTILISSETSHIFCIIISNIRETMSYFVYYQMHQLLFWWLCDPFLWSAKTVGEWKLLTCCAKPSTTESFILVEIKLNSNLSFIGIVKLWKGMCGLCAKGGSTLVFVHLLYRKGSIWRFNWVSWEFLMKSFRS